MNLSQRMVNLSVLFFILFLSILFFCLFSRPVQAEGPIGELALQLDQLHDLTETRQSGLRKLRSTVRKISQQIVQHDERSSELQAREQHLEQELDGISERIIALELEVQHLTASLEELKQIQVERLIAFEKTEPTSLVSELFFGKEKAHEADLVSLLMEVQRKDRKRADQLIDTEEAIATKQTEEQELLFQQRDAHKIIREQRIEATELLENKRQLKKELLSEKKKVENQIFSLQKQALQLESLKQEIFESTDESLVLSDTDRVHGGKETFVTDSVVKSTFTNRTLSRPVVGRIMKRFGKVTEAAGMKNGILIRSDGDSEVRSVAKGVVNFVGKIPFFGLSVIIGHGPGEYSLYGQLKQAFVKGADAVIPGTPIGELVPQSNGDLLLYLEFRKGRESINPEPFFKP